MQRAQVHLYTSMRNILCRLPHLPSVRRVEKRGADLWLECSNCHHMKPEKKFQRVLCSITNRASICRDCGKISTAKREHNIKERRKLSAVI